MKNRCLIFVFILLLCSFLSGCELLGLLEVDTAAVGAGALTEAGTMTELGSATELGTANSVVPLTVDEAPITEFKTIIRSDLDIDNYNLLKQHLTPGEFEVIDGMVSSEADVNSLLSKVRVARAGTSLPRLYIDIEGTDEGVEFAEVTSDQTIRLLRSGNEYSLPGDLYTTNSNTVYLKDLQNYKILAHINPHQVILVLEEFPASGVVEARMGTTVGLIPAASILAVSKKKYAVNSHRNNFNYRAVVCSKCGGKKRFECTKCAGTGKLLCPYCHGAKNLLCPRCNGSGKQLCTTCKGYGSYYCPDCHGTGRIGSNFCATCNGTGKVFCKVCGGKGTILCTVCQGREMIVCPKCFGYGNISCDICNGQGYLLCGKCHGTGVNWIASN